MSGKQGFGKAGGSSDFSGQRKKGKPQREALSSALKMFAEMMLANRQAQKLTPENDEVDSPEDRDSPEIIKNDDGGPGGPQGQAPQGGASGQRRKAKSRTLYGDAKSNPKPATSSKPEGIKKGTRFG